MIAGSRTYDFDKLKIISEIESSVSSGYDQLAVQTIKRLIPMFNGTLSKIDSLDYYEQYLLGITVPNDMYFLHIDTHSGL